MVPNKNLGFSPAWLFRRPFLLLLLLRCLPLARPQVAVVVDEAAEADAVLRRRPRRPRLRCNSSICD
jgi:hypothetical protein